MYAGRGSSGPGRGRPQLCVRTWGLCLNRCPRDAMQQRRCQAIPLPRAVPRASVGGRTSDRAATTLGAVATVSLSLSPSPPSLSPGWPPPPARALTP